MPLSITTLPELSKGTLKRAVVAVVVPLTVNKPMFEKRVLPESETVEVLTKLKVPKLTNRTRARVPKNCKGEVEGQVKVPEERIMRSRKLRVVLTPMEVVEAPVKATIALLAF